MSHLLLVLGLAAFVLSVSEALIRKNSRQPWVFSGLSALCAAYVVYLGYVRLNLPQDWAALVPPPVAAIGQALIGLRLAAFLLEVLPEAFSKPITRWALVLSCLAGAETPVWLVPGPGPWGLLAELVLVVAHGVGMAGWNNPGRRRLIGIHLAAIPFLCAAEWNKFLTGGNFEALAAGYALLVIVQAARIHRVPVSGEAGSAPIPEAPGRRFTFLGLTARETEVLELLLGHHRPDIIADRLFVSVRTIHSHLEHIYRKAGVTGRIELLERLSRVPEQE